MNIFLLIRYGYDPDGDSCIDEIIGTFKTHKLATLAMNEDIKKWHWSCHIDKEKYEIEEVKLVEEE